MARGLLSGVVGGFLQGAGEGITAQAKEDGLAKREARLAELQHGYAMERQGQQNAFTASENAANRENTLANTALQGENTRANTILQGQIQAGRDGVWEERTDPKTGATYLRNSRTGDVKAMPGATVERWETITGQDGEQYQRNAKTGELKAVPTGTGLYGTPGEGLVWKRDEQGRIVKDENGAPVAVAYQGGKVAREEAKANEKKDLGKDSQRKYGDVVTEDIDRALGMIDEGAFGIGVPVTGTAGSVTKHIPGSQAYDVAKLIDTVKANVGFDRLQEMRASSPTGAALGSVTEKELAFLQATVGALDQSQSEEQVVYNLRRVKNAFLDTIHGAGNGPEREPVGTNRGTAGSSTTSTTSTPTNPRAAAASGRPSQPPPSASAATQPTQPPRITNDAAGRAAYDRLPSGATFIAPDGTTRRKP